MAAPTLGLTFGSMKKQKSIPRNDSDDGDNMQSLPQDNFISSPFSKSDNKFRKFWGEEVNDDSVYSIYLKKITYSFNNNNICVKSSAIHRIAKGYSEFHDLDNAIPSKWDQNDGAKKEKPKEGNVQCLQWETRQTRILRAASLNHLVQYMLLLTSHQQHDDELKNCGNTVLEEERNNIAHAMHVLFCTYRLYCTPHELYETIMKYSVNCCAVQFNFVMHYWLDNYPEDFTTPISHRNGTISTPELSSNSLSSTGDSDNSYVSEFQMSSSNTSSSSSSSSISPEKQIKCVTLIDALLSVPNIDDTLYRKGISVLQIKKETSPDFVSTNQKSISKSSSVLELDPRFVAQQLTAIDLENFLSLKPYSLLNGSRSEPKIQQMIKNFNLLSRHVIISILRGHSPHIVAAHWIEVAFQLRKIRNFNSLKAIIAGLTNESVYRLKQTVWSKISRSSVTIFKNLSPIVDDINNQTLLRHTQLIKEGTSKVTLEDESFGTIPYLGTFLTDITMIDSRYQTYVRTPTNKKLINFEKCSQQYEILTQIQLLQKNVIAALTALQQQSQQIGRAYLPIQKICSPTIPRVARIFRVWFQANDIATITDKQCYELSLSMESSPVKMKT